MLAHRLGLIPLRVDPRQMEGITPGEDPTDLNTVVYKLQVSKRARLTACFAVALG